MESLIEEYLVEDVKEKKKRLKTKLRNIRKHYESIKAFSSFLNKDYKMPMAHCIMKAKFLELLIYRNTNVVLSINAVYDHNGEIIFLEVITTNKNLILIYDIHELMTFEGLKIKKQTNLSRKDFTPCIDINKLFSHDRHETLKICSTLKAFCNEASYGFKNEEEDN